MPVISGIGVPSRRRSETLRKAVERSLWRFRSKTSSALGEKTAKYRWFLIRYNPLIDERGNVVRWYPTTTCGIPSAAPGIMEVPGCLAAGPRLALGVI